MQRDGQLTSLWQHNQPDFHARFSGALPAEIDVVIAGGGITGVTTALLLQQEGWRCLLAEAHTLGFGTTGGTTSHINSFLDTDYHTIESDFGKDAIHLVAHATKEALDLFHHHVETYQIDCGYEQQDGYLYAQTEKQSEYLDKIYLASKKAGVEVSYTDRIPVPYPFVKAIVYRDQAQINPAPYLYALAKAFEEAGGLIVQHCAVEENVETEEAVTVRTSSGVIKARWLIYATHIPTGINLLHFRCAPYRSYAMAVKLKTDYPLGLSYDMYDPYHYFRTQEVDGEPYLIAGGEDHKTGHVENTEACFNRLEAHVRSHFDVDHVAFRWSSQFFEPSDGLAYIGLLPGSKGRVLVATGFSGNGITYSHIAARLLTDLVCKKENACAALFTPNRIKPVAGFTAFIKENADVVKEFVGKRIGIESLQELVELAPGEGKVVKFEGKKLAIHKDEQGRVYALNPVCTHAKCIVTWNGAEQSWDCPCHGARYSVEGEVLSGPARAALEPVELTALMEKK